MKSLWDYFHHPIVDALFFVIGTTYVVVGLVQRESFWQGIWVAWMFFIAVDSAVDLILWFFERKERRARSDL